MRKHARMFTAVMMAFLATVAGCSQAEPKATVELARQVAVPSEQPTTTSAPSPTPSSTPATSTPTKKSAKGPSSADEARQGWCEAHRSAVKELRSIREAGKQPPKVWIDSYTKTFEYYMLAFVAHKGVAEMIRVRSDLQGVIFGPEDYIFKC